MSQSPSLPAAEETTSGLELQLYFSIKALSQLSSESDFRYNHYLFYHQVNATLQLIPEYNICLISISAQSSLVIEIKGMARQSKNSVLLYLFFYMGIKPKTFQMQKNPLASLTSVFVTWKLCRFQRHIPFHITHRRDKKFTVYHVSKAFQVYRLSSYPRWRLLSATSCAYDAEYDASEYSLNKRIQKETKIEN